MADIASLEDKRGIYVDDVGVKGVRIPIRVKDRAAKRPYQYTIGTFDAFVELEPNQRGTHMSRIVEVIYNNRENINAEGLKTLAKELATKLKARRSKVKISFPYFIDRWSPVSKLHNLMTYQTRFEMIFELTDNMPPVEWYTFKLGASVDIMTVCPCALEECGTGASHVQRGQVNIDVKPKDEEWIWLEDLIEIAETAGSSPVYERLKRKDEAQIVLNGFKQPQFVEDVVRDAVIAVTKLPIDGYCISCENYESIHQHNAYAEVYRGWK